MQRKIGRPRNTLIELALTIIETYHLDHFVGNPKRPMIVGRRFWFNDSKDVVNVHVVMPEPR